LKFTAKYIVQIGIEIIKKIKTKFLRKFFILFYFIIFIHGEKKNFEEYFVNLASAKLSFPTLINDLAEKVLIVPPHYGSINI
jgi:hypothetical protein